MHSTFGGRPVTADGVVWRTIQPCAGSGLEESALVGERDVAQAPKMPPPQKQPTATIRITLLSMCSFLFSKEKEAAKQLGKQTSTNSNPQPNSDFGLTFLGLKPMSVDAKLSGEALNVLYGTSNAPCCAP